MNQFKIHMAKAYVKCLKFSTQTTNTFRMFQASGQRFQSDKRIILDILPTEIDPMIFVNGFTSCDYRKNSQNIKKTS